MTTRAAIIFDHDGTLVDSEILHYQCWHDVMLSYGQAISEQEYSEFHNGVPTLKNAEVFIETYQLQISAETLAEQKRALYRERSLNKPGPLMPTAMKALEAVKQFGLLSAIATGAESDDIDRSLSAHQLQAHFDAIATRSDVPNGKPAPDVYLLACDKLGVPPDACVALEDTQAGIASAKAAGLVCIAIPNAYSKYQDLSQADAECRDLITAVELAESTFLKR